MKFKQSEPPYQCAEPYARQSMKKGMDSQKTKVFYVYFKRWKIRRTMHYYVHNLSYDSFFIHYWIKFQNNIYKSYANSENYCTVHTDATVSLVKKLKDDQQISNHIFLYGIVIHLDNKPINICQMLS